MNMGVGNNADGADYSEEDHNNEEGGIEPNSNQKSKKN